MSPMRGRLPLFPLALLSGLLVVGGCSCEDLIGGWVVEPGGTIQGRVTDSETGAPIEGVLVYTSGRAGYVKTNAEGLFLIERARKGQQHISFYKPGYRSSSLAVTVEIGKVAEANISLDPEPEASGGLKGKVVSKVGDSPLADAEVKVTGIAVYTSEDGLFMVSGVPAGEWDLEARKSGYLPYSARVVVVEGEEKDLGLVRLTPGTARVTVEGEVRDLDTREPVPGAAVFIGDRGGVTDEEGRFTIRDVLVGLQTVIVEKSGYERLEATAMITDPPEFLLLYIAKSGITPPAAPYTVAGRVLDESGKPVEGAEVTASDEAGKEVARTTTDEEGAFRLLLRPGTYTLVAEHPQLGRGERRVEVKWGHILVGVDITLSK